MAGYEDIRTGRHCVFLLHAHLVNAAKYRHEVFTDAHLIRLEEIMRDVCGDFEVEPAEFHGESNHLHPLVNFPPKVALSTLVNSLNWSTHSKACRHGGCAPSSPTWCATTTGRTSCGRGPTSPDPSAAPRSRSCATTSNSRTTRHRARSRPGGRSRAGLHPRPEGRSTGPHSGSTDSHSIDSQRAHGR